MPFVTVTKETRIFSPWFPVIEYIDPSGMKQRRNAFTALIPKGSVYNTGAVETAHPYSLGTDPVFFEITEYKNPNYIFFDMVLLRGYSSHNAAAAGYANGFYTGALQSGPIDYIPRWSHNGEYYYRGRRIEIPATNSDDFKSHLTRSYYPNLVRTGTPVLGMRTLHAGGMRQFTAEPAAQENYTKLVAETEFAGLFAIKKFYRGGVNGFGDRYEVRCPLSFNVILMEWFTPVDMVAGGKQGPTSPGLIPQPIGWSSSSGSKPVSGAQWINRTNGSVSVLATMMIGTDGDNYTIINTCSTTQGFSFEVLRFRFEIPYGID